MAGDVNAVLSAIQTLDGKVDKLVVAQASWESRAKYIDLQIDEVRETLYGNGQPGLKDRMAHLETEHQTCYSRPESPDEIKNRRKTEWGNVVAVSVISSVSSAFIVGLGAWLLGIFKTH